MRLNRLDLTRYGKFTDRNIDFGAPTPGKPDLHIVYGPNEAGKSTALAAFLDLLFGIETRSRYNFLHPHNTMRVGGALEIGGATHEFARVKRNRDTLLDGSGAPIAEALLAGQLGGIDRDSYRAMFSLDDDTLEQGGESILASKGDLGQLLFSASAGLADLSRSLVGLRAEADAIYRFHAHGTELTAYKRRLAELKDERDKIDTAASRYAALTEARDRAHEQYEAAIKTRTEILSRRDAIRRHIDALPRLARLFSLREQMQPLADLPAAPADWHSLLPTLRDESITLAERDKALDRERAELETALQNIVVDEAACSVAEQLDRLNDLHARYVTADKDVPIRKLEVRAAETRIAGILGRIGRVAERDPRGLLFDATTTGRLQDLIAQQSGIETAHAGAERELREAGERLQEAEAALSTSAPNAADPVPEPPRLATLAGVVTAVQNSDFDVRRRNAERSKRTQQDQLAERLLSLQPWQGDAEQLASLTVPEDAELDLWQAELNAAQNQHVRREQELETAKQTAARLVAERDAIVRSAGIATNEQAGLIRARREAAWAEHRRTLDLASADAFEAAMRQDDIVMNELLRHEAEVTRLQQVEEALARNDADALHAQEEHDKAKLRRDKIEQRIGEGSRPFLPGATPEMLRAWLGRRTKALEARAALRQAEGDLSDAVADGAELRRQLAEVLVIAGVPINPEATLEHLRGVARAVLDRQAALQVQRDAVQERRREQTSRERQLQVAAKRLGDWQSAWAAACQSCWLGEGGTVPSVAAVREMLAALAELRPALEQRVSLLDRIEKMEIDQGDFATEATTVASSLGWTDTGESPLVLFGKITKRIDETRTARTLRNNKHRDLEAVRARQRKHTEAQAMHASRSREMLDFLGVSSLAEAGTMLADIARRADLQEQADAAKRDILEVLHSPSIEAAELQLAGADRAALETELAMLEPRFADQDQRTHAQYAEYTRACDELDRVGGDEAVARIDEQRRTVLLEIEDRAAQYLRLRAGIIAAEHALRAYRQQHRSAMMTQASEAFRTISRGAYSGLSSQPKKDMEDVLIAIGADGSSKEAAELSKGTRFQLYLALRYAGYSEFARLRPPVPFIADDILETFDDDRAEQALRLMAKIGEVGQAIYLTHHRHLCEIGRQVCPEVHLHGL
jgi:uncharacterized protein YhaN